MALWYYTDKRGIKIGPINSEELKQLAQRGTITPTTIVETKDGKKAERKVKGLFLEVAALPVPPAVPTSVPVPPVVYRSPQSGGMLQWIKRHKIPFISGVGLVAFWLFVAVVLTGPGGKTRDRAVDELPKVAEVEEEKPGETQVEDKELEKDAKENKPDTPVVRNLKKLLPVPSDANFKDDIVVKIIGRIDNGACKDCEFESTSGGVQYQHDGKDYDKSYNVVVITNPKAPQKNRVYTVSLGGDLLLVNSPLGDLGFNEITVSDWAKMPAMDRLWMVGKVLYNNLVSQSKITKFPVSTSEWVRVTRADAMWFVHQLDTFAQLEQLAYAQGNGGSHFRSGKQNTECTMGVVVQMILRDGPEYNLFYDDSDFRVVDPDDLDSFTNAIVKASKNGKPPKKIIDPWVQDASLCVATKKQWKEGTYNQKLSAAGHWILVNDNIMPKSMDHLKTLAVNFTSSVDALICHESVAEDEDVRGSAAFTLALMIGSGDYDVLLELEKTEE